MFKLAELRCCCRKSSHINVVEKRKCKKSFFVRQKLLSESTGSVDDTFSTYGNIKIAPRIVYIFLHPPSALRASEPALKREGTGRLLSRSSSMFLLAVQCCVQLLWLEFLWEHWRAVQEHTWVHLRHTEQGNSRAQAGFVSLPAWNGICWWDLVCVIALSFPKGLWASSKEGVCPSAFPSLLNIK